MRPWAGGLSSPHAARAVVTVETFQTTGIGRRERRRPQQGDEGVYVGGSNWSCQEHQVGAERENVCLSRPLTSDVRMVWVPVEGQRQAPAGTGHLSITLQGPDLWVPEGTMLTPSRPWGWDTHSCRHPGLLRRPVPAQGPGLSRQVLSTPRELSSLCTHLLLPLRHEIWPLTRPPSAQAECGSTRVAWPPLSPVCPSEGALC